MKNWKELYREIKVDNEIDNGINEKKKNERDIYPSSLFSLIS